MKYSTYGVGNSRRNRFSDCGGYGCESCENECSELHKKLDEAANRPTALTFILQYYSLSEERLFVEGFCMLNIFILYDYGENIPHSTHDIPTTVQSAILVVIHVSFRLPIYPAGDSYQVSSAQFLGIVVIENQLL